MEYTKKAIQLAIESGYPGYPQCSHCGGEQADTLLDPEFWKALGKAVGWKEYIGKFSSEDGSSCDFNGGMETFSFDSFEWKLKWLQLIDHLAEGKTPEEYFKSIL